MMAVGTCCTRSISRKVSHPSAGPTTTLPATARRKVGATAADREAVRGDGADREAVNQERARVIQQALAFEDRQDAMRRPQLAEHGGCRNGVGWSDDSAQSNGRRPRHRRDERAGDEATATVVNPTAKTTRPVTGAQLSLRSRSDASYAASSRTGATNSASASSGGR